VIYVFDTNAITDLLKATPNMVARVRTVQETHILCLCQAVDYEIERGYLWRGAAGQIERYRTEIKPRFQWLPLADQDWKRAGELWAGTRRHGKQLSDIDLLIAALALRLNAVIVSADEDSDTTPARRENWRTPPGDQQAGG
jgi:predicted nucleic acid-binding protein